MAGRSPARDPNRPFGPVFTGWHAALTENPAIQYDLRPLSPEYSPVAQLVERVTVNH